MTEKKEFKNIKVKYISIITGNMTPKNKEKALVKGEKNRRLIKAEVYKNETLKGHLHVKVMTPNKVDTEGHFFSREAVKQAFLEFLKKDDFNVFDENHNREILSDVSLIATYLDDEGAWIAVLDISKNSDLMEKASNDEINGVSIDATGVQAGQLLQKAKKIINFITKKNKEVSDMDKEELEQFIVSTVTKTINSIEDKKKQNEEMLKSKQEQELLKAENKELKKKIEEISGNVEELIKGATKSKAWKDGGEKTPEELLKGQDDFSEFITWES